MSRKPISQLNTTYTDTQDGDTLPMDRGGAIGKVTFLTLFNGFVAKLLTGTTQFGTVVAGFLRVTTSSSTSIDLQATATADTHERLRINKNTTGWGFYTANAGATVTIPDHFVNVDASGANLHTLDIGGVAAFQVFGTGAQVNAPAPQMRLNDTSGTPSTHQIAYFQYNDGTFSRNEMDSAGAYVRSGMFYYAGAPSSGPAWQLYGSGTLARQIDANDKATETQTIRPLNDGVSGCGASGRRWNTVYSTNGTINTSDAREKEDISLLSDAEIRLAQRLKGLVRTYRWKRDPAKKHFGVIAQEVIEAFDAEGLNWQDYGVITGGGDEPFGVNYAELHSLILGA